MFRVLLFLLLLTVCVVVTAVLSVAIMRRKMWRERSTPETRDEVSDLNKKLNSLYAMLRAVGSKRRLDPVLKVVTSELAGVMEVPAVTVKLLSEDGKTLRYAAAHGLPPAFAEQKVVEVARSRLNRKIIEGDTLVFGEVTEKDAFQLQDDLLAFGIRSVVFVPLTIEDRVIGILGAYSREGDRFTHADTGFFRLAAELVAIAIEDARAYEAVHDLLQERSRFMLRMAHNMRAPLTSTLSMLDLLCQGYLGEVDPRQMEHLRRMDRRLRALNTAVDELMTLSRNREGAVELERDLVELKPLAARLRGTFAEEAARKGLTLRIEIPEEFPEVIGDARMLEQMLENLISNAIKYTPTGGNVDVRFERADTQWIRIEVRDTGIGIPRSEQPRVFSEFFRASNAKKVEEAGTGLGLAIVKQIVELHGGSIQLTSEEGRGTSFLVDLPLQSKSRV